LAEDRAAWLRFRDRLHDDLDQFVVQDFVRGTTAEMWSVGIYADQTSQVLATFAFKKIRGYPAQYGETKIGQNDEVPPALLDQLRRAVRAVGLQGIAEFEFRRDRVTGEFKLLDINPRAWTWIGITNASPADIPWVAYQDLCGVSQEPVSETRPPGSLKFVFLLSDFLSVIYRYRRDHPPWVMSPLRWWRGLKAERLVIVEFNRRDWQPGLFFAFFVLKSIAKRISGRLLMRSSSKANASARDLE
jgi:predicted ATP-grasp superfamily ATP-dependent carboligase